MSERLRPEQLAKLRLSLRGLASFLRDDLSAPSNSETVRDAVAALHALENERDAWHRRWLDETATSEQFERERDDARAALRLIQEA